MCGIYYVYNSVFLTGGVLLSFISFLDVLYCYGGGYSYRI